MKEHQTIPKFVSIVTILIGCYDLLRGFMHTINLGYASTQIAGLDLSGSTAYDQLQVMATLGMSNFVSGVALILIGLNARKIALIMLGTIPASYAVGIVSLRYHGADVAPSQANWGGAIPLMVYLAICAITFIAGLVMTQMNKKKGQIS